MQLQPLFCLLQYTFSLATMNALLPSHSHPSVNSIILRIRSLLTGFLLQLQGPESKRKEAIRGYFPKLPTRLPSRYSLTRPKSTLALSHL